MPTRRSGPTAPADPDPAGLPGLRQLRRHVQLMLTTSLVGANVIGAAVVTVLALVVIPGPSVFHGSALLVSTIAVPVYVVVAVLLGVLGGTLRALHPLDWLRAGREPNPAEAQATFGLPRRLVVVQASLWAGAAALFTPLYGIADPQNIARVLFPILLGGVVVCANAYLVAELALRPVSVRALRVAVPHRRAGVRGRLLLAWALGSGSPLVGLMVVAIFALVRTDVSRVRLATTVLALGAVTLTFGLLLMLFVARATTAPIRDLRQALRALAGGDLDAAVAVDDRTELGELQTGFNEMAAGLRERERVRDLFGRHVGHSVATAALAGAAGSALGGEERFVGVLFVDVVGSTAMAEERPPAEVVALLNRFFSIAIEEVERHGGLVNKLLGDAALGVFGAPTPLPDPAGCALAAARTVSARLAVEMPGLQVGAGVSAGPAVAGNVGARERFEYTVIGDPVNSAARLGDLAKSADGPLASGAAVAAADPAERRRWARRGEQRLRGRSADTEVWVPA